MPRSNAFASTLPTMITRGCVMDTEELRNQLREITAMDSIDASADRGEIEDRARLYRRHRHRLISGIAAVGAVGLLVVLIVLTSGGDDHQSVRTPPAQQGNAL